jgi:hypothetical protein
MFDEGAVGYWEPDSDTTVYRVWWMVDFEFFFLNFS